MSVRVLLADDHLVVRQGLKALLESQGLHVVAEAGQGQEAVHLASAEKPDGAVLDVSMPVLNGLDAALEIRRVSPKTRTILLTVHNEDQYVTAAIQAGIRGYVLKSQGTVDLVDAIRQVHDGQAYLSPGISRAVVDAFLSKTTPVSEPLSARERQVVQLIGEGQSTKTIADVLGISVKTVESHRARLMRKLDIHDVASLVRYAIRRGLVQPWANWSAVCACCEGRVHGQAGVEVLQTRASCASSSVAAIGSPTRTRSRKRITGHP